MGCPLILVGCLALSSVGPAAVPPAPDRQVWYERSRDSRWVCVRSLTSIAYPYGDHRLGYPPRHCDPGRWWQFDEVIQHAAQVYGLDPALIKSILWIESRFVPQARSVKGALGVGQLMPGTAKNLGVQHPEDPNECIWGTAAYLRRTADQFDTMNMVILTGSYNSGPKAVAKALQRAQREGDNHLMQLIPRNKETPGYVSDVLWTWDRIHRGLQD